VTGPVGAGKSTVMSWLSDRGAATLDADLVVHRLLSEDAEIVDRVRQRFGDSVVAGTGPQVDRSALAAIVFADSAELAALEAIVHPAVGTAVADWLVAVDGEVAAVEAVKLIESGMHRQLDAVWLVTCGRTERHRRLVARGSEPDDAARRIDASPPLGPQLAAADVVVDNTGSPGATSRQLEVAWRELLQS
jgi:dephospho-CoA kinase